MPSRKTSIATFAVAQDSLTANSQAPQDINFANDENVNENSDPIEVLALREENVKHFKLKDGSFQTAYTANRFTEKIRKAHVRISTIHLR